MNRRTFNVAAVNAELRASIAIEKFVQEFEQNGNQNQPGQQPALRQTNPATGNVPSGQTPIQQPVYGG